MSPASRAGTGGRIADPLGGGVSAVVNVVVLMAFLSGAFGPTQDFRRPAGDRRRAPLTYFIDIVDGVYLDGDSFFADPKALAIVLAWGLAGGHRPAALRLDAPRALR